jgi:hypothetical protein
MQLEGEIATEAKLNPEQVGLVIKATNTQINNLNNETFRSLKITGTAFGGYEGAKVVVATHGSAHSIATEMIRGVKEDLEGFVTQLTQAMSRSTGADELSSAALLRMSEVEVTDHGNTRHDRAVHSTGFATNDTHVQGNLPTTTTTPPAPAVCAAPGEES